jgi:hypothetical protein
VRVKSSWMTLVLRRIRLVCKLGGAGEKNRCSNKIASWRDKKKKQLKRKMIVMKKGLNVCKFRNG